MDKELLPGKRVIPHCRLMVVAGSGVFSSKNVPLTGTDNENEYMFMLRARELYRDLVYKMDNPSALPHATMWADTPEPYIPPSIT